MKKIFALLVGFLLTFSTAFSADMRFIQVDGLFYNPQKSNEFETLIEKINNEKDVEFIVFTGNNISKPDKKYLEEFLKLAKNLKRPFYVVLGQKDVNKQKQLGKAEYMKVLNKKAKAHRKITSPNYVFVKKGLVFIVADGSKEVIPSSMGYYRDKVILWLDEQLDTYHDKNVVILQHYPIVPPAKKEARYTYKAEDYMKLLTEHKNVKAIFAGHFGVNNEQTVDGILHVSTDNAPIYRIVDILDYDTEKPSFWSTIKE